jgi:hypothetical protein
LFESISTRFRTRVARVVRDATLRRCGAGFLAMKPPAEPFIWTSGLVVIRAFRLSRLSSGDNVAPFFVVGFIPACRMGHVPTDVARHQIVAHAVYRSRIIPKLDIARVRGLMDGIMTGAIAGTGVLWFSLSQRHPPYPTWQLDGAFRWLSACICVALALAFERAMRRWKNP